MAAATNQVRLPFDKLTEKNLQPVVKKFKKWGVEVASIDAPNKGKRESGSLLKDVTFIFSDGQKMLIRVKSDGTVFQVKLNNKVMPIRNVDNMDKAIMELAGYVEDNAKAYEKAKIQRERRRKLNIAPPSVTTTRQEKIQKAKDELAQVSSSNNELEAQLAEKEDALAPIRVKLKAAQDELAAEKEKTKVLETTLASLNAQGE